MGLRFQIWSLKHAPSVAGCWENDRRNPPAKDEQRETCQDKRSETLVASPRVALVLLVVLLGHALLDCGRVDVLEDGGRAGGGPLSPNDLLLFV